MHVVVTHVTDVRLITRQSTAKSAGKVASSPRTGCWTAGQRKNFYHGDSEFLSRMLAACVPGIHGDL